MVAQKMNLKPGDIYAPTYVVNKLINLLDIDIEQQTIPPIYEVAIKLNCRLNFPTIYDVATWIRNTHNMNISVDFDSSQLWGYRLYHCSTNNSYINSDSMYNNFESALLAGICDAIIRIEYNKKNYDNI